MQIEAGKFYRTRDGRKVGPICRGEVSNPGYYWRSANGQLLGYGSAWHKDGSFHESESCRDLIAEWTDEPDKPKTWGDMTRHEQGEILVDDHNGKEIQAFVHGDFWEEKKNGFPYFPNKSYRKKPTPVRETVTMGVRHCGTDKWYTPGTPGSTPTHRITFTTIGGEPDCASITMSKLDEVAS